MNTQTEMPFFALLPQTRFAPASVVDGFESYRDAVMWVWENRARHGAGERVDQAICANHIGLHTPHMSRCVAPKSKAPMNLSPDHIKAFEAFCGWHAVSQFLAKQKDFTLMEQVIEERRQA